MSDRFIFCLGWVINQVEGGRKFTNYSDDPGKGTYSGLTQTTWVDAGKGGSVQDASDSDVAEVYRNKFWDPSGAPMLPVGADLAVYAAAINPGLPWALKTIRGLPGSFAPTSAYVAKVGTDSFINSLLDAQAAHYRAIVGKPGKAPLADLQGLLNRVELVREAALGKKEGQWHPPLPLF